jgi:hypothetical protein
MLPIANAELEAGFGLLGERVLIRTNRRAILESAEASFGRFQVAAGDREPLRVTIVAEASPGVPEGLEGDPPGAERNGSEPGATHGGARPGSAARGGGPPRVTFRTLGSRFIITSDQGDVGVADLDRGEAVGFVSGPTVADQQFLRYSFIEAFALSMVQRARGYVSVHATGICRDGAGIVLQGPSGVGKSTLAMAGARRGHGVFADDVVFGREGPAGLELWGLPWTQRMLADASIEFPELAGILPRERPNGEMKLEVDLDSVYPGRAVPTAGPLAIVTLERASSGPMRLEPVDPDDDAALELLWAWDAGWGAAHDRVATLLARVPTYRLRLAGSPDEAVRTLEALFASPAAPVTERG